MSTPLAPPLTDAEQLVSAVLRRHPEVAAIVGDRVYTVLPAAATYPLVRVTRVGGQPVVGSPLVLDAALVQIDAYGGPKRLAWSLAETVRRVLAATLEGVHPEGRCSGVRLGALRNLPDPTFDPARPRYLIDVTVYLRPAAAPAGP